ncbi:hypothetical protein [Spiroplasma monobiae]|uniref:Transmembrane protein n=1 Tax=Spiroplasma monobiae MQ-1 TaxID=1336748 RepID=A0A2K9LVQ0_SPISQ|nr:hypothetical protein [Spiroplasma monobiae]AUM63001.1 hypothetical protein SMONO_v1c07520 [Spiroplasma monobiae MQ-1]
MKKIRENKNLIIFFTIIFLSFPIQNLFENKTVVVSISLFINVILILISFYFVTAFSSKFLKHAEDYNFELSKGNLENINSLNRNFRFYITMFTILALFTISIISTYSSLSYTDKLAGEIEWWNKNQLYKYLNFDYFNIAFFCLMLLINILFLYAVGYIVSCLFIYSIMKIVFTSNRVFIEKIYKKSIVLSFIIKKLMQKMAQANLKIESIEKTWKDKIILISNIESEELKTIKKGNTPPELF